MGENYGYNPADFANDFSWIGRAGAHISKFASQMPELIDLNKQIKENNKFKNISYSSMNKFIDKLDDNKISNIAASMDISASDMNEARRLIKEKIPKFSDRTTNEEYAKQIIDNFTVPFYQAANSKKGGGVLSFGELMSGGLTAPLQNALTSTAAGKEYLADEASQKALEQRGKELEMGAKSQYGDADFSKGTYGAQQDANIAADEEKRIAEQERDQESGAMISGGQQDTEDPRVAYDNVIKQGGTQKDAQAAYNNVMSINEEKRRDDDARARMANRRWDKKQLSELNPDVFPDMIRESSNVVGGVLDDITKLKENQKNPTKKLTSRAFEKQLNELEMQKEVATANQKSFKYAYKYYLNNADKTKKGGIEAQRVGQATEQAEREIRNPKPLPGQNIYSKDYGPTTQRVGQPNSGQYAPEDKFDSFIQDVKEQMQRNGKLDERTTGYLKAHLDSKGITSRQFFESIGLASGQGGSASGGGQFNYTTDEDKDWKRIRQAKDILGKPDDPMWDIPKANARSYLDSEKIKY